MEEVGWIMRQHNPNANVLLKNLSNGQKTRRKRAAVALSRLASCGTRTQNIRRTETSPVPGEHWGSLQRPRVPSRLPQPSGCQTRRICQDELKEPDSSVESVPIEEHEGSRPSDAALFVYGSGVGQGAQAGATLIVG